MLFKKLSITLFSFVLTMCLSITSIFATQVYLGGESIGIKLNYEGVLISGTFDITVDGKIYDPKDLGFKKGDLITYIENVRIKSIDELMSYIQSHLNKKCFNVTLKRNNKIIKNKLYISISNNQFSTGLYVQDQIAGIGTVTYYNPLNQSFAALGHMMESYDSKKIILNNGYIYKSYVTGIIKSKKGKPGEKIADIDNVDIGNISKNNAYGIYGHYKENYITNQELITTATKDEVEKGKAYFLTVIDGNKQYKCEIDITDINKDSTSKIKGITFKITDKYIINKTNGIVQGMSGSPIIQNGKLIGAVTHVLVNNPHMGYGLFIENMLNVMK